MNADKIYSVSNNELGRIYFMDMECTEKNSGKRTDEKKGSRTTQFLIGSFILLLLISVEAFVHLGRYMSRISEESINKVGNMYMAGINNHIIAHFRTLIDLKLEQAEAVVAVVPADMDSMDALHEELVYRSSIRNFNYLALCSADGNIEMLSGQPIHLADPVPFQESLRRGEKKVAVGSDATGNAVVMFGVCADYPMENGERCMALVAAVSIEYISTMLGTDEENALMYSHIIRSDGSFVVSDMSGTYTDYFSSLYDRYETDDSQKIDAYISQLTEAMKKKEKYSGTLNLDGSIQQVYCTPLPYSEWNLVTILPFGGLNETVESLDQNRTIATMIVLGVILIFLLLIFYVYFKMTCQQLKNLETARQEALEATKAKSVFLSNMSHDIRTPMNAIVGMTAIATAHIDDKEQVRNCLKKITLSGKHLLGLINDVLDMSKIESGKMTLTAELVSLREVLEEIVGIVQTQAKGRGQNFNIHINSIVTEDVYCDSVRLNQVLLNLLSNAVKYTPDGGTIQLSLFQEEAPGQRADKYVRTHIVVKDNGIGMSPEFLQHIFDSYSRADSKRVQKTEGAGLGMAITKYIVDAMEGTITVTSEPQRGTEFHVILDMEKASTQENDMVLPPWSVLVADDDEMLCRSATDALKSIGINAEWTLSGEKAVQLAVEHHERQDDYQIVLLDWKLPDMDGLCVSKKIREAIGTDVCIILTSAYDWSDFEADARVAGINGFIAKPLFKSTLYYGLRKYMNMEDTENRTDTDADLSGLHILAAEDNELNWEILNELLTDIGMELDWAENGKICLEKFQESEPGQYDAILMDVRMPVMSGLEATSAIRALNRPDARTIPIIAMTADAFSEDIKRCLDSGMNAHTAKPINIGDMTALLKKFVRR